MEKGHAKQAFKSLYKSFDMSCLNPYYCALMLESTLPERVKPIKFARRGTSFVGKLALDKFERLVIDALSRLGNVEIEAEFSFEEGFPTFIGKASTSVQLKCQRCLEPVDVPLNVSLNVAFVSSEESAAEVPEPFEAVLLESEEISIVEVVEEELILALPIVPYHETCDAYDYRTPDEKEDQASDKGGSENPFSVLEQLKGSLKSDD